MDDETFDLDDPGHNALAVAPRSRVLELLPPRTRVVFLTKAFRMPVAHAAEAMGISREAFYEHLRAALAVVRRELDGPPAPPCSLCRERPRGVTTTWCAMCQSWYRRAKKQMQARRRRDEAARAE